MKLLSVPVYLLFRTLGLIQAQDPVGAAEGLVTDTSNATVAAHVVAKNLDTGLQRENGCNGQRPAPDSFIAGWEV